MAMFNDNVIGEKLSYQGSLIRVSGRVDTIEQLPATGSFNQVFLKGPAEGPAWTKFLWDPEHPESIQDGHGKGWRNIGTSRLMQPDARYAGALGGYSITSLVNNLTCEFRMNFPIQSIRFGYYALAIDGVCYTDAVPVNQPIRTSVDIFNVSGRLSVVFYDLRDIMTEDWGTLAEQSWDSLLTQKWFTVEQNTPVSLELALKKISELADVQYGTLKTIEE